MVHTFYIVVNSGATIPLTTGPLTLSVYCGPNSATVTESEYEDIQYVQVGETTAYFSFPAFTTDSDCKPVIYKVFWMKQDGVALD